MRALVARAGTGAAAVVTGSPVRRVDSDGTSVTGVVLAGGRRIAADAYVFCAGAATPGLLAGLGGPAYASREAERFPAYKRALMASIRAAPLVPGDAPQSPAPCLVGHVQTGADPIRRVVQSADLSMRPLLPAGPYLEAGDVNDGIDVHTGPAALDRGVAELLTRARSVLPGLDGPAPATGRICVRPLPADGMPIIGWLPGLANAYLIVTHSGKTLGALLGRLATAELLGAPQLVLEPYRPTRF